MITYPIESVIPNVAYGDDDSYQNICLILMTLFRFDVVELGQSYGTEPV